MGSRTILNYCYMLSLFYPYIPFQFTANGGGNLGLVS